MNMMQAIKMAWKAVASNRMRSFLTMLGVIIGVFAVSVLVSVVQGATDSVTSQLSSLGGNLITVTVRTTRQPLTLKDLPDVRKLPGIADCTVTVSTAGSLRLGNQKHDCAVEGTTPEAVLVRDEEVTDGRFISQNDIDNRLSTMVMGVEVADDLFGTRDVVGQKVTFSGRQFTIVGVLKENGTTMLGSRDDRVVIPITTAQRITRQTNIRQFYVAAKDEDSIDLALESLDAYLKDRTKTDDGFTVFAQSQLVDVISTMTGMMTGMLGGIAAISLLVGGIGIMNIMLVSVTERTREIGIRKAIGARRHDILIQFLVEAMFITLFGGALGLVLAQLGTRLIGDMMDLALDLTPGVIALSVGFSLFIGLVFGIYPAGKAANLQPIEALRHE